MTSAKPIYVEITIEGSLDEIWHLTQTPELHARWDLRFTEIRYLARVDFNVPQRFLYATRIGLGLKIEGQGETIDTRTSETGERASSLKFWSDDCKSLICKGSGYWKYIPVSSSVRFLTLYDYRVRFGVLGELGDRFVFRPVMGWATAWSFDRLRLWVESGIPPEAALRSAAAYFLSRISVAFVWFWHGLVPKLLFHHPDEGIMLTDAGASDIAARYGVSIAGMVEIALALWVLLAWRSLLPMFVTILLMLAAFVGVALFSPRMIAMPFNP
ncbi:MAG: hypothetical protein JWM99_4852, partial [Verrucomicrobiales bacterium]|nr:hypothetical protein [Verrucomicrobiales bacterium]